MHAPLVVALVLLLALATAAANGLVAQPLEPLVAEPIAMHQVGATSATLLVTTDVDLACVVVFGTDPGFGNLALDQDMGGAAHRDHRVLLRGLRPDTEYVFRLQGSAPDGRFYASEVYAFRTLPAEEEARAWRNVATLDAGARVLDASSAFGAAFAPEHAIDGTPSSEWSSRGDGDAAYLRIELAEPTTFLGFGVWSRSMGSSAEIRRFEVETDAGEVFGPFDLPSADEPFTFDARGTAQRFTVRVLASTGGNTGLIEFAVYADDE